VNPSMVRLKMIVHSIAVDSDSLGLELASNIQTMPNRNPQMVAMMTRLVVNYFSSSSIGFSFVKG
jgi:hypothetical protein